MDKVLFLKTIKNKFSQYVHDDWDCKFEIYASYLIEQNKKMNLTRLCSENALYQDYFLNSIMPFSNFNLNHKKVLDIGSGSGIPGIALKIIFKHMQLYIIEANAKKCEFLKQLSQKLELQDVYILHQRAENIDTKYREYFDIVTSRAVASLKVLLEISAPYAKIGGLLIEPKSINYQHELVLAKNMFNDLGIELDDVQHMITNIEMYNLIFKKNKNTNKKYPRSWKQIKS